MPAPRELEPIGPAEYRLGPAEGVAVRVFGSDKLVDAMDDQVFVQAQNVAKLPGVVEASFCMPDAHWGYGFPIGGVAAIDPDRGVISPGGIGFDINCGMRLVRTQLSWPEVKPKLRALVDSLADRVPAGVGSRGFVRISEREFRDVLVDGSRWAVRAGYGTPADLEVTEERGAFSGANPEHVSEKAIRRGLHQIGTLGSGNHYLEIQVLHPSGVFDREAARVFGLDLPDQVVVMFHCGSRGFGHQIATDYLDLFLRAMPSKFGLRIVDRELACAPFRSQEGQAYFGAMCCAANMAAANRQVITHRIREVFASVFGRNPDALGLDTIYDVAHNTAKLEEHQVGGRTRTLLVHRKGATRAFPPGHPDLPERYRRTGQPVIIGGSMETGSFVLVGVASGAKTFYSTAHGSGRTMSRTRARKRVRGSRLKQQMEERGLVVRAASLRGLAEEAGFAYKNVDEVAEATERAGLSRRVARLAPVGNVKG